MESKVCTICKKNKEITFFNKNKRIKDGYHYSCRPCVKEYAKLRYDKENSKKYYNSNIIEIKKNRKIFRDNNKEKIKEQNKKSYKKSSIKMLAQKKIYCKKNKEKIIKYQTKYQREYRQRKILTDDLYKAKTTIRDLIKRAIRDKNFTKKSKAAQILGCSFEEFKKYIENKWESWMIWENYGNWNGISNEINKSWEYDHIIPVCTAKTKEEFIKLNHYTNFQPLCSYTNRNIKRAKT